MSALQSGLLWWLAMSVSFTLGWGMCALVSQGRDVERRWRWEIKRKAKEDQRKELKVRRAERASAQEAARNNRGRCALLPGLRGLSRHRGVSSKPRSPITSQARIST